MNLNRDLHLKIQLLIIKFSYQKQNNSKTIRWMCRYRLGMIVYILVSCMADTEICSKKLLFSVFLQILAFPFQFCDSWCHQFVWLLQQSGKLLSRELWLNMGWLKNLFPWLQTLYQRFLPLTRGSSLPWGLEHGWEGSSFMTLYLKPKLSISGINNQYVPSLWLLNCFSNSIRSV